MLNTRLVDEAVNKSGGEKKSLQRMVLNGQIDQLTATIAAMRIDRIRNAAKLDQLNQPTVAEQVLNPQAQPQVAQQGMAAMPQAQQMPPQAQMGQPAQQPMMAARGGMLEIPYNEGDYAEGGIVGFNVAGSVYAQAKAQLERQLAASRIQSERDAIKGQLAQLEAQYRQPTYQPSLAAADLSTATEEQTGGNRFNTGTLTEAEARRIEGRDMMDNVERGFGMFTDFVKSKLPSFGSDDPEQFAKVKDAQPSEIPGESARAQRVAARTGKQSAGVEAIASPEDLLNVGMETFADPQQATTPTPQNAPMRSQQIPTSLGPKVGRGQDPRLFGETPEERLAYRQSQIQPQGLNAIAKPMTAEQAIAALGEDGTRPMDLSMPPPLVSPEQQADMETADIAKQVAKTEETAKTMQGKTKGKTDAEIDDIVGDGALRDMGLSPFGANQTEITDKGEGDIPNQFAAESYEDFEKRMGQYMPKSEVGEYRKEFDALMKDTKGRMQKSRKEAFSMALLQAGLGMLSQQGGQTALQALGKAALPATKQYAATMKDLKKEDRELMKLGLSLENMDAKERAATQRLMANMYGAQEARKLSARAQIMSSKITAGKKGVDARVLDSLIAQYGEQEGTQKYLQAMEARAKAGAATSGGFSAMRAYNDKVAIQQKFIAEAVKEFQDDALVQFKAQKAGKTVEQYKKDRLAEIEKAYPMPDPAAFGLSAPAGAPGGQTQQPPIEGQDKNGKAIISYDGGQNWVYK